MKFSKIWINFLPFAAPVPVILVNIFKPNIVEIFGDSFYKVATVVSISFAIILFSAPFIQMFREFLPFLSGGGYNSFWGSGKKAQNILKTGHSATAEVINIGENSGGGTMTINQQPVLNLSVKINIDSQQPYNANMDILIPRSQVPQFQPGAVFPVKISKDDPSFFVLDVNSNMEITDIVVEPANNVGGEDWTDSEKKAVKERGIDGTAKITDIIDTGRSENFKPVVKIIYEISIPGKSAYKSQRDYNLETSVIHKLKNSKGKVFKARVHPENKERFIIEIEF